MSSDRSIYLDESKFSSEELEILSPANQDHLSSLQLNILEELALRYQIGAPDLAVDRHKVHAYKLRIQKLRQQEEELEDPSHTCLPKTSSTYRTLSWYTLFRMLLGALYNLIDVLKKAMQKGVGILPEQLKHQIFGLAGLTFGVELLIDSGFLLKSFLLRTEEQKKIGIKQHFINMMHKGNRWRRMLNASVWLTINFIAFVATGGLWGYVAAAGMFAAYINIAGFTFDIFHEFFATRWEIKKRLTLDAKLAQRLQTLDATQVEQKIEKDWIETRRAVLQNETTLARKKHLIGVVNSILFLLGFSLFVLAGGPFATTLSAVGLSIFIGATLSAMYSRCYITLDTIAKEQVSPVHKARPVSPLALLHQHGRSPQHKLAQANGKPKSARTPKPAPSSFNWEKWCPCFYSNQRSGRSSALRAAPARPRH